MSKFTQYLRTHGAGGILDFLEGVEATPAAKAVVASLTPAATTEVNKVGAMVSQVVISAIGQKAPAVSSIANPIVAEIVLTTERAVLAALAKL